jgi:hypothetical protein
MGILSFVETRVRGIVQGAVQLVIPVTVQEQEIHDALREALREAMRGNVETADGREIAPDHWQVSLNPHDYAALKGKGPALNERLALNLKHLGNERGYLFKRAVAVSLEKDDKVGSGRVVCQALTGTNAAPGANAPAGPDATQTIEAGAVAQAPIAPEPPVQIPAAWLTLVAPSRGQPMRLDRQTIRIGRHNTNDIIVNERRVSRFHAEIRFERDRFMLYDLSSINGVLVNGARATRPVPLQDRDIISVPGQDAQHPYQFVFQRG